MAHDICSLLYDFIRDNEIATEEEISLVTNINGWIVFVPNYTFRGASQFTVGNGAARTPAG